METRDSHPPLLPSTDQGRRAMLEIYGLNDETLTIDDWQNQALRTMKMQAAYRKAEAAHPRENAPKAEQIRSLGLIGKEEETAAVLKA